MGEPCGGFLFSGCPRLPFFPLTCFSPYVTAVLQEFILEDIRPRYELLMSWLYQEYGASESIGIHGDDFELRQSYGDCLLNLMDGLYSKLDPKDK